MSEIVKLGHAVACGAAIVIVACITLGVLP